MSRQPVPCQGCGREIYFEGSCYSCRTREERERYLSMPDDAVHATLQEIAQRIETMEEWDTVFKDFCGLLAYRDINTEHIAEAAFAKGVFYPPFIYRNASRAVRDKMIEMLMEPESKHANNLLSCLAMCGDDAVLEFFLKLERNPLPWREKLYVDPSYYAQCGGWSFDKQGNRFSLLFPSCYALLPTADGPPDSAAVIGEPREEQCSVCGCQTVDILRLDENDQRLAFLGLNGGLRVPCCPNCAMMCEKTLVRYTLNGDSTFEIIEPFAEENYIDDKALKGLASNGLKLSQNPVPPFYACGGDGVCTIGGFADWVQDWHYETCPDCGKHMRLLGAIVWDTLIEDSEGTLYMEICADCRVISLFHQQT